MCVRLALTLGPARCLSFRPSRWSLGPSCVHPVRLRCFFLHYCLVEAVLQCSGHNQAYFPRKGRDLETPSRWLRMMYESCEVIAFDLPL